MHIKENKMKQHRMTSSKMISILTMVTMLFIIVLTSRCAMGDETTPTESEIPPWFPGALNEPDYSTSLEGKWFTNFADYPSIPVAGYSEYIIAHIWEFDPSTYEWFLYDTLYDYENNPYNETFIVYKGTYIPRKSVLELTNIEGIFPTDDTHQTFETETAQGLGFGKFVYPYYADDDLFQLATFVKTSDTENTLEGTWQMTKRYYGNAEDDLDGMALHKSIETEYKLQFDGETVTADYIQRVYQEDGNTIDQDTKTTFTAPYSIEQVSIADQVFNNLKIQWDFRPNFSTTMFLIKDHRLLVGMRLDFILDIGASVQIPYFEYFTEPLGTCRPY